MFLNLVGVGRGDKLLMGWLRYRTSPLYSYCDLLARAPDDERVAQAAAHTGVAGSGGAVAGAGEAEGVEDGHGAADA